MYIINSMDIALIFSLSLLWVLIVARIIWRVIQKRDPLTAVMPTIVVSTVNKIPTVLTKASKAKERQEYIDNNG